MQLERVNVRWSLGLWWVLASTAGLVASLPLGFGVGGAMVLLGVGVGGGVTQWLVLRHQVSRTGWWVLASSVSLVVFFQSLHFGLHVVNLIVFGLVSAAITWIALAWLLRRSVAEG